MVNLYVKSENSLLTSLITIRDYINYANTFNIKVLGLADENLFGLMKFYNLCIENNIKPLIGLTIKFNHQPIVLYAINEDGYHNLLKLATKNSEGEINVSDLESFSDNLICIVPKTSLDIINIIDKIYRYVFIGYSTLQEREEISINLPKIFFRETLCINKTDTPYVSYLEAIRKGITIDEVKVSKVPCHMFNNDFEIPKEDIENINKIVDICNVKISHEKDLLPIYNCPDNLSSYDYLKKLCVIGLRKIFGDKVSKVYQERLKYELDVINKMGFCNYFLVVWDYVKYAKEHDILVGPGRGSAGGSLVSYCLNITTIDPIKYDLLFERFLNPERVTMPDIDIDFEDEKREEVINYCINKYGVKNVAGIIAYGTLASRQVLRDVGRALDIELSEIDNICKMVDTKLSLTNNLNTNNNLKKYINSNKTYQKLYKIALKLEGLKRHTTIHAAGIVMCRCELDKVIPLYKSRDNFYLTGYSMKYLEPLGLLKMDFLALKNLTLIHNILRLIKKYEFVDINFDNIPLDDYEATNIFTTTNTVGIFQFESSGMMNFLRKLKASSFADINAAIALFRPGPMGNIDTYIKRKQGREKVVYPDPSLESILKSTYGIIIYQEQIMQIARLMANFTFAEADLLRRAMSKKNHEIIKKERERFIKQSILNGYSELISSNVYDLIEKFASYGFNKAHSVGYSVVAYRMAYLKAHYSVYFHTSLLSNVLGSEIKTKEYIYECKKNNIKVLKPDINISSSVYTIENKAIRVPLTLIKGLGMKAVETIIEKRNERIFTDIYDFLCRCYGKSLNKKVVTNLIYSGALDSFNINKKTLIENLDLIINYAELIKELDESLVEKPVITNYPEYSRQELMNFEKELFGFYLSNHPVTEVRNKLNLNITIGDIPAYFDKRINIIVLIDKIKTVNTKNNDEMCFIVGSDEVKTMDFVLFPRTYQKYHNLLEGSVIKVSGKVEKRFDKYQVVVDEISVIAS